MTPERKTWLLQLEQALLADGYELVSGNTAAWPNSDILFRRGESLLYLGLWQPDRRMPLRFLWNEFYLEHPDAGLLLVGDDPPGDPDVLVFLQTTRGAVVYLDTTSASFRLRPSATLAPSSATTLTEAGMRELLDTAQALEPREEPIHAALLAQTGLPAEEDDEEDLDDAPPEVQRRPYVTYTIIGLCCAMYLLTLLTSDHPLLGPSDDALQRWGGMYGPLVRAGEWWRLLTVTLLHGNHLHIFFNMAAAAAFMPTLELWQGRWRLLLLYVYSALTASLLSLWWHPHIHSVGASGALFGMLGAMIAVFLRYRGQMHPTFRARMLHWLESVVIANVLISFLPIVDGAAHFGGLLGGFALGWIIIRQPFSDERLSPRAQELMWTLLAVTGVIGFYIIRHIPQ